MLLPSAVPLMTLISFVFGKSQANSAECLSNKDCPGDKLCAEFRCINPCLLNLCDDPLSCKVSNHIPVCSCRPHAGECESTNDCSSDRVCEEHKCVNPCQRTVCGDTMNCSVSNHITICNSKETATSKGQKKFLINNDGLTWHEAVRNCRSQGMTLASIESQEEQERLVQQLKQIPSGDTWYWLGGTDQLQEGWFLWLSAGGPLPYTNYHQYEPDNVRSDGCQSQDCLSLSGVSTNYTWYDDCCGNKQNSICQYY